jgi:hypothetical protein
MEIIFNGKLSDITHISNFLVLFEKLFWKGLIKLEVVL